MYSTVYAAHDIDFDIEPERLRLQQMEETFKKRHGTDAHVGSDMCLLEKARFEDACSQKIMNTGRGPREIWSSDNLSHLRMNTLPSKNSESLKPASKKSQLFYYWSALM